jgi:hypothetical protein
MALVLEEYKIMNDLDIQCALFVDNTGTPLTPWEKGVIVKRLLDLGYSEKDIYERLGIKNSPSTPT